MSGLDDLTTCVECGYEHPERYCWRRVEDDGVRLCRGDAEERMSRIKRNVRVRPTGGAGDGVCEEWGAGRQVTGVNVVEVFAGWACCWWAFVMMIGEVESWVKAESPKKK